MTREFSPPFEPGQPVSWWLQPAMTVASAAFGVGSIVRKLAYDYRLLPVRWATVPVVSVGNLVVGGTGKTPFVIWLANLLNKQGRRVAVVSRGYGRRPRGGCPVVVSTGDGALTTADIAGDEPSLIARRTSAIVVVDSDRVRGAHAAANLGAEVIVIDDGFSHRRLGRDLDLVLLANPTPRRGFLPSGPLREPESALRRADLCLVVGPTIRAKGPAGRPLVRARVVPTAVYAPGSDPFPAQHLQNRRVAILSAIAKPLRFRRTVEALGSTVVHEETYRDHTPLTEFMMDAFLARAAETGADFALTTEKDAMRVTKPWPARLHVLRIEIEIIEGAEHLEWALLRVGALG